MPRILFPDLRAFVHDALRSAGVPEHVASVEADITAEVDLCGVHSHGVRMLPATIANLQEGVTNGDPSLDAIQSTPAAILLEGNHGIGRYVSATAMDRACDLAEQSGVGLVLLRNAAHWGRSYSYARRAAMKGFVGLAFTNTITLFPAWGASEKTLGNNPMGIGIPHGEDPVVIDMAMMQSYVGRIRERAQTGEPIPSNWALDANGKPTEDASAAIDAMRFLPMGGHKGSSLAFVIELLTAGLAGGLLCNEMGADGKPTDSGGASSKCFIAFKPFGEWLPERVHTLKSHLESAPRFEEQGDLLWPGQRSSRDRKRQLEEGIDLPNALVDVVNTLATERGLNVTWIEE